MTLLERVQKTSSTHAGTSEYFKIETEICRRLRHRLYEVLPSSKIAYLAAKDRGLAKREVEGALEILSKSVCPELSEEMRVAVILQVKDMVLGLGPLQSLMDDPHVTEVMANGLNSVYFEKGGKLYRSNLHFDNHDQFRSVIDRILGPVGRRVDEQSPMVSARLLGGHRANVVVEPIAKDGPFLTIRKFRETAYTLDDLIQMGSIDKLSALFLTKAVVERKNIAVTGGTGSGKTTLLNVLSAIIPHDERVVTIEDSAELKFNEHPHVVSLEARPKNSEGLGEITIRDLVTNALRMRPDRIVVGECRGAEALDMLQAMSTGHDGSLTTLHANSSEEAINRLVTMVRYGSNVPVDVVKEQIVSAIDLFVHIERMRDGSRKLVEISACEADEGEVCIKKLMQFDKTTGKNVWDKALCAQMFLGWESFEFEEDFLSADETYVGTEYVDTNECVNAKHMEHTERMEHMGAKQEAGYGIC